MRQIYPDFRLSDRGERRTSSFEKGEYEGKDEDRNAERERLVRIV